jgi:hypothetical protein
MQAAKELKLSKVLHMHARRRNSSQSKEEDSKTPSCEARRFFQDEDKEEVTSMSPP